MKKALCQGEIVHADRGYSGDETVRYPDMVFSRADKRAMSKARERHETVYARFKVYCALSIVLRHDPDLHQFVYHDVAVIPQIFFENGSPPFSALY
jgi:hypothetical protein